MAIYNIAAVTGYELPSAPWINNDADIRPKPLQFDVGPECDTSVAFLQSGVCYQTFGDRYLAYSKIKSGSIASDRSNNSEINSITGVLPIRITEYGASIRGNEYNEALGVFNSGYPTVNVYYLPKQKVSSTYAMTTNFYSHKNPTTNIKENIYESFLPSNYTDKFSTKSTVLIAETINPSLSTKTQKNTYVCAYFNNITVNFIQPTYDNQSGNYTTYGNLGISFDPLDENSISNQSYIFTNISYSGETIVNIVHDSIYNNTEVGIKHPLINNYLLINLPSSNTTLNLENYQ